MTDIYYNQKEGAYLSEEKMLIYYNEALLLRNIGSFSDYVKSLGYEKINLVEIEEDS